MTKMMKSSREERVLPPLLKAAGLRIAITLSSAEKRVGEPVMAAWPSLDGWQWGGGLVGPASPSLDGWQWGGGLVEPASPSLDGWQIDACGHM